MPHLFVANLNFEQELAGDRQSLPKPVERMAAELAACWLPLAAPGDYVWCPQPFDPRFWRRMAKRWLSEVQGVSELSQVPSGLELVPWGWSGAVERFGRRAHARCERPPVSAVMRANSRRLAFDLETGYNAGLPRAAAVNSMAELERALREFGPNERWVLKTEFGAAARNRVRGAGQTANSTAAGWIRRRLAAGEWLFLEPWVRRIAEVGVQWSIPRDGPAVLEGVTGLLTSSGGEYRGSVFGLPPAFLEEWRPAIDVCRRAVERIQQEGYFGPVGIDAMRYRDADGTEHLRPLQDINARWTMGRLSLGWQRLYSSGTWRQGSAEEFARRARSNPRVIRTSPEIVGGTRARWATWLEP